MLTFLRTEHSSAWHCRPEWPSSNQPSFGFGETRICITACASLSKMHLPDLSVIVNIKMSPRPHVSTPTCFLCLFSSIGTTLVKLELGQPHLPSCSSNMPNEYLGKAWWTETPVAQSPLFFCDSTQPFQHQEVPKAVPLQGYGMVTRPLSTVAPSFATDGRWSDFSS